jgi:hypothetical protein
VTGDWTKLNNEELHNLYSSPKIIRMKSRRMRWPGHGGERISVGKPEGKRPLGSQRHMDNIKIDISEIEWDGLDLSGSG